MLNFIMNFLNNRRFIVKNASTYSDVFIQENGIPQGSVLSVILFLIAINDINSHIKFPVHNLCFADDLVIFCRDRDVDYIRNTLQETIKTLEEWSNRTGFTFSTNKTKCMHFKQRVTQFLTNPTLTLNNEHLEYVPTFRYLGVILDQRMNWIPHFKHIKQNCSKTINILKYLSNQGWGADRPSLMKVYKSFICSKINYASVAYSSARKSSFYIIDVIFNKCLRIVSGAFHTSPILSIYCEAGEPPPQNKRDVILSKYCLKLLQNIQHILHNTVKHPHLLESYFTHPLPKSPQPFPIKFHQLLSEFTFDLNCLMRCDDDQNEVTAPWMLRTANVNTSLTKFNKSSTDGNTYKQNLMQQLEGLQSHTNIFTDGSKTSIGTGCAFTDTGKQYEYAYTLHKMCSVYTAEMYSISKAIDYIAEINDQYITVFTDSLSSILTINQLFTTNILARKIQQKIHNQILNNRIITLFWIPSHIGITGNEIADDLANRAANSILNVDTRNTITCSDAINILQKQIYGKWESEWNNITNNKLREHKPHTRRYISPIKRRDQLAITRILIGHSKLTHNFLLDRLNPPQCNICRQSITIKHILFECRRYNSQRNHYRIQEIQNIADKTQFQILTTLQSYFTSINLIDEL